MKYGWAVALTFLFLVAMLYFGLNQAEREINNLAGVDSPPESFTFNTDKEELVIITFAGTDYPVSTSGLKEIIVSPGQLIHTFWHKLQNK